MLKATLAFKGCWAHKRRLLGRRAVFLGVAFLSGTLVLSDTCATTSTPCSPTSPAGTDVVVRSATDRWPTSTPSEQASSAPWSTTSPARRRRRGRRRRSIEGYGQILGADGEAIGGRSAAARRQLDRPGAQPVRPGRGAARPRGDDEVVINRGAPEDGDLAVGDTHHGAHARAGRGHDRRASPPSATEDGLGGDVTSSSTSTPRMYLIAGRQVTACSSGPRTASPGGPRRPRAGAAPRRSRCSPASELTAEEHRRHQRAVPRLLQQRSCWCSPASPCWWGRSASTTRSRSSWPSAPRVGAAAGGRRQPAPGPRPARGGVLVGMVASVVGLVGRHRAGRAAQGPVQRLRVRLAGRRHRRHRRAPWSWAWWSACWSRWLAGAGPASAAVRPPGGAARGRGGLAPAPPSGAGWGGGSPWSGPASACAAGCSRATAPAGPASASAWCWSSSGWSVLGPVLAPPGRPCSAHRRPAPGRDRLARPRERQPQPAAHGGRRRR